MRKEKKMRMAKLLVGACALMFGIVAQAAAVNWSIQNIQGPPDVAVSAGWLVEVYTADVDFTYDAAKNNTITPWDSGSIVAATPTVFRILGKGSQENKTTVTYFAVIYDAATVAGAKNYIVSALVPVTASEGGASANLAFGNMASTAASNKFLNSTWDAVPEPTSGLLALLGFAGLALRRRRG